MNPTDPINSPRSSSPPDASASSPPAARPFLPPLKKPVQFVKGVGPRRAAQLARLGITIVEDLLYHIPFRYQDRREIRKIRELPLGEEGATVGQLVRMGRRFVTRSRRWVLEGVVRDETGFLFLRWYNQHRYFEQRYQLGQRVLLYGKVEMGLKGGKWMIHPDMELLEEEEDTARILPIYNKTTEMTVAAMRRLVHGAVAEYVDLIPNSVPPEITARLGLMDLSAALRHLHFPPLDADHRCVVVMVLGREIAGQLRQQVLQRELAAGREFTQPLEPDVDDLSAALHQSVREGQHDASRRHRHGRLAI